MFWMNSEKLLKWMFKIKLLKFNNVFYWYKYVLFLWISCVSGVNIRVISFFF